MCWYKRKPREVGHQFCNDAQDGALLALIQAHAQSILKKPITMCSVTKVVRSEKAGSKNVTANSDHVLLCGNILYYCN